MAPFSPATPGPLTASQGSNAAAKTAFARQRTFVWVCCVIRFVFRLRIPCCSLFARLSAREVLFENLLHPLLDLRGGLFFIALPLLGVLVFDLVARG